MVLDLPDIVRGVLFSTYAMWEEITSLNLMTAAPTMRMPVFFFVGRHDRVVAPATTAAYFDMLAAPSERLLWFEESAHQPPFEEPAKFDEALTEIVWPLSV